MTKKLTIGMATRDDYMGVWLTVTSLVTHHNEVRDQFEIVVVDNNPRGAKGQLTKRFIEGKKLGRYVAFPEPKGTAQPREEIFRQARTPYVLVVDSHVMLWPGVVKRLLDYYDQNPSTPDLLQGPLMTENGGFMGTHQRPEWGSGSYGKWSQDNDLKNPDAPEKEIWQQGLGLFSCRREAWVSFHPDMRGFGGCETYIAEKFRQRGGRVLCLPFLRWIHCFSDPDQHKFPVLKEDKCRNYLIGFEELGLDTEQVRRHFGLSDARVEQILGKKPNKPVVQEPVASLAVIGDTKYGGVKMRGGALNRATRCKVIPTSKLSGAGHRKVLVCIKCLPPEARDKCDFLVYDPLDIFYSNSNQEPETYWREQWEKVHFDAILATTGCGQEIMRRQLPDHVPVYLVPHQCDELPNPSWRDPNGPVAYAGQSCFIESKLSVIERACAEAGKDFRRGLSVGTLMGSSVCLALRCAPYNSAMVRLFKPQIKLENAAAAGLPVVASDHPCVTSTRGHLRTVTDDFTVEELATAIRESINAPGLRFPYTEIHFLKDMQKILVPRLT